MLTLYWPGFPALVNWLARGEVERPADIRTPPAPPESATQREVRWADEAADFECTPIRWGNFR